MRLRPVGIFCPPTQIVAAMAPKKKINEKTSPAVAIPAEWPQPVCTAEGPSHDADPDIVARLERPGEHGGVLASGKFIVARLLQTGLASKIVLSPKQLGLSPDNRSEYGINEDAVHRLGKNIMDLGFDIDEIVNPWCVQEDPVDQYITRYTTSITEDSTMLAKVSDPIVAGTLTNGHVTLLLRCILAGVPCEHSKLSVDGKMSIARIEELSPEMAEAAVKGWQWTMIHHPVRHIYGSSLFSFLSDIKNVTISAKESEIQVLLKASLTALKFKKETGEIPWDRVHEKIAQTKPDCADYVHCLIHFVKEYSGGDGAHFVKDFAKFHSRHVPAERIIGGTFFEHLTNLQVRTEDKTQVRVPLLKYAILKCQSACPPTAVLARECRFISMSDLDKLVRTKAKDCMDAEALLRKSREVVLLAKNPVPEQERTKLFGRLDINVARILLSKQQGSQRIFNRIEEAAYAFFEDLPPSSGLISNPWSAHAPPAAGGEKPTAQSGLQNYSCDGRHIPNDIQAELKSLGFEVDSVVRLKKSKDVNDCAQIKSIGDDKVKLQKHSDKSIVELTKDEFVAKYLVHTEEKYPFCEGTDAQTHDAYIKLSLKNTIGSAMYSLTMASSKPNLHIFSKPTKRVVSQDKYKVGELMLTPASLTVSSGKLADKPATASIVTTTFKHDSATVFWLNAPAISTDVSKKPLVAPFWLIPKTSEVDKVNMEIHKVSVKVSMDVGLKSNNYKTEHKIDFEVFRNTKAIKEGDDLLALEVETPQAKKKQRKS